MLVYLKECVMVMVGVLQCMSLFVFGIMFNVDVCCMFVFFNGLKLKCTEDVFRNNICMCLKASMIEFEKNEG